MRLRGGMLKDKPRFSSNLTEIKRVLHQQEDIDVVWLGLRGRIHLQRTLKLIRSYIPESSNAVIS